MSRANSLFRSTPRRQGPRGHSKEAVPAALVPGWRGGERSAGLLAALRGRTLMSALNLDSAAPASPVRRRRGLKAELLARPGLARFAVVILLFGIWEIAARFYVDKMFLAPPSAVFTTLPAIFTPGVIAALRITAGELLAPSSPFRALGADCRAIDA